MTNSKRTIFQSRMNMTFMHGIWSSLPLHHIQLPFYRPLMYLLILSRMDSSIHDILFLLRRDCEQARYKSCEINIYQAYVHSLISFMLILFPNLVSSLLLDSKGSSFMTQRTEWWDKERRWQTADSELAICFLSHWNLRTKRINLSSRWKGDPFLSFPTPFHPSILVIFNFFKNKYPILFCFFKNSLHLCISISLSSSLSISNLHTPNSPFSSLLTQKNKYNTIL